MRWQLSVSKKRLLQPGDTDPKKWPMFKGGLSYRDYAMIINWIVNHVENARPNAHLWRRTLFMECHAATCLLVHRRKDAYAADPDCPDDSQVVERSRFMLARAWRDQASSPMKFAEDVEVESIRRLEEEMFDRSEDAGVAGNCQWGLDVGDHQEKWNPYPINDVNCDIREGSESELMVSLGLYNLRFELTMRSAGATSLR